MAPKEESFQNPVSKYNYKCTEYRPTASPETGFLIANAQYRYCSEHYAAASCLNAIEAVVSTASMALKQLAAA
jgi:hypothetical protein